jgi:hypothetical protein
LLDPLPSVGGRLQGRQWIGRGTKSRDLAGLDIAFVLVAVDSDRGVGWRRGDALAEPPVELAEFVRSKARTEMMDANVRSITHLISEGLPTGGTPITTIGRRRVASEHRLHGERVGALQKRSTPRVEKEERGDEDEHKEEDKHADHNPHDNIHGFNVVGHTAVRQINPEAWESRSDVS